VFPFHPEGFAFMEPESVQATPWGSGLQLSETTVFGVSQKEFPGCLAQRYGGVDVLCFGHRLPQRSAADTETQWQWAIQTGGM
jgi:hypothetical protein